MRKDKKHKVAFFVDGSFLPIRNGTYYSIYSLMTSLAKVAKIDVNLIVCNRGWDNPKLYVNKPFRTIFVSPEDYYGNTNTLRHILSSHEIRYLHFYGADDVLKIGKKLKNNAVKIIYEAINIDHVLYGRLNYDKKVIKELRKVQKEAMMLANEIMCRSEVDKGHIENMGISSKKITVYRGAINVSSIKYKDRIKKNYKVVFLGHMYYPPNENALKIIAESILPKLKNINKNYSVDILGIIPHNTVKEYKQDGLVFRGGVNNLGNKLLSYNVAIAPIFEGSGTRLKLLDFLASGIPTITTDLGIEGLEKKIKKYFIIENDIDRYPLAIDNVVNNISKYSNFSKKGRGYIEKKYDWDNNLKPFLSIYKKNEKRN